MTRTEDALQRSMVEWLGTCVPPPPEGPWWRAVNPISSKTKSVAGRSKAMGMKAGTPDLVFCIQGRFVGIEVRAPGKYLSAVQQDAHMDITLSRGLAYTVRSIDELEGFLRGLGVPMRGRIAA